MEQNKLEALVNEYVEAQQKMGRERQRLQQLAAATTRQLKEAAAAGRPLDEHFFGLYQRLIQVLISQVDRFKVDGTPELLSHSALLGIKWSGTESQLLLLQLDQLNLERLHRIVEADLPAALEGRAPAETYPPAWLALRGRLAGSPDWQQALRTFQLDYPGFRQAVEQASQAFERLNAQPLQPGHLKEAKALDLPALKGQHYRLETIFRKLPEGQGLLDDTRIRTVEVGTELEASVPKDASPAKKITGLLKGFFK